MMNLPARGYDALPASSFRGQRCVFIMDSVKRHGFAQDSAQFPVQKRFFRQIPSGFLKRPWGGAGTGIEPF